MPSFDLPAPSTSAHSHRSNPLAFARSLFSKASASIPQRERGPHDKSGSPAPLDRTTSLFLFGCLAWYTTSALSSNTSKALLSSPKHLHPRPPPLFPYPVTLTLVQFGFVFAFCAVCGSRSLLGRRRLTVIVKPSWARVKEVGQLSVFNVVGHVLSSLAISRVPVSTVHTIKALSPLFTVISYWYFFHVRYSTWTWASLVPLTLGVSMACTGLALSADDVTGLIAALGSTLIFVAQNIYSKKLLSKGKDAGTSTHGHAGQGGEGKMDKINILFYSSGCAFALMLPVCLYSDGRALLFPRSIPRGYGSLAHAAGSSVAGRVLWLLLCNGVVHFAQNLLAFNILGLVSPVTYSIASLFKRVFVIVMAIIWFGQSVSMMQGFGIILTFVGLYMYNDSKTKQDVTKGEAKMRRQERIADLILPTTRSQGMQDLALDDVKGSSTYVPHTAQPYNPSSMAHGWNPHAHSNMSARPPHSAGVGGPGVGAGFADFSAAGVGAGAGVGGQHAHHHPSALRMDLASSVQRRASPSPSPLSAGGGGGSSKAYLHDPTRSLPSPPHSGRNSSEAGEKRDD